MTILKTSSLEILNEVVEIENPDVFRWNKVFPLIPNPDRAIENIALECQNR